MLPDSYFDVTEDADKIFSDFLNETNSPDFEEFLEQE
jgi:hypothetical protein